MNRVQLAALLGVHEDTVTDYARNGMPVVARGGAGREGEYDAVVCLDWWRQERGIGAKEKEQTRLYAANADNAELKLQERRRELLSAEEYITEAKAIQKGWSSLVRAWPRQARLQGVIETAQQEAALANLTRRLLVNVSNWKTVADIELAIASLEQPLDDTPDAAPVTD